MQTLKQYTSAADRHGSIKVSIKSFQRSVVIFSLSQPPGLSLESLNHTLPMPLRYFWQILPLYGAQ